MNVIIAGSKNNKYPMSDLESVIQRSGFEITTVFVGATSGIGKLAALWAEQHHIPVQYFLADWKNITRVGCILQKGEHDYYDAYAGARRNKLMLEHADALIAIWNGYSPDVADVIKRAVGKPIYNVIY